MLDQGSTNNDYTVIPSVPLTNDEQLSYQTGRTKFYPRPDGFGEGKKRHGCIEALLLLRIAPLHANGVIVDQVKFTAALPHF